jgi:hypothetical protein
VTDLDDVPALPAETPSTPKRGGGPKTPEGKARSRQNSLKHGLTSKTVLPYDLAEAVARRTEEFMAEFQPRTPYQAFLVRQLALAAARLDRCAEMTIADVRRVRRRAHFIWDHDRRMAVEGLGARIAKDPAGVVAALRGCKQGAIWLGERWELLGLIAANTGDWTEEQRRMALDLLGIPAALREGSEMLPAPGDAEGMAELVAFQLDILRQDREAILDKLDAEERGMALEGMSMEEDATTARLRKYEGSCRRAFNAAKAELLRLREAEAAAKEEVARPGPEEGRPSQSLRAEAEAAARRAEADLARARGVVADRPAVAEAPKAVATSPSRPAPVPSPAPMNRRERRAQAKRDRQAARQASR